ncbi:MAG: endonuclease domain-containing protein [Chloroflexota bacterium]|nr:endonuclease domain-containing protein [Chloroflexota bacterium]
MPSNRRIGGRPANLVPAARLLRHEMTPAERQLWAAPRRHQLAGLQIRRQHPIGPFAVDFACAARRLGIEVDGGVHVERTVQDAARRRSWSSTGDAYRAFGTMR